MKTLVVVFVCSTVTLRSGEPPAPSLREKLRARILESVPPPPPPPPPKPPGVTPEGEDAAPPPVTMSPVVVSDSRLIREVASAIQREEQERRDEKFSGLQGGTIAKVGPMELGGWWSPSGGWTFLRLNKAPTYRQTVAAESRIKELQELSAIGRPTKSPAPPPP